MDSIPTNTVLYNGVNLYDVAFLRIFSYNVLTPSLRPRKVRVPLRSGEYDYGAKYHDERTVRAECLIERPISEEQFDNLKYALSRKGRIIFWDHTDRFYYGQIYNAAEVLEYGRLRAATFQLEFTCDPYAYALEPTTLTSMQQTIPIEYKGTRETPTRIVIRNTGSSSLRGIQVVAREIT